MFAELQVVRRIVLETSLVFNNDYYIGNTRYKGRSEVSPNFWGGLRCLFPFH